MAKNRYKQVKKVFSISLGEYDQPDKKLNNRV